MKNKSSGIDLNVPTYKETPGLLGSSVEYQVVVVSSLPFFKSPKHRESDVVQFVVNVKTIPIICLSVHPYMYVCIVGFVLKGIFPNLLPF